MKTALTLFGLLLASLIPVSASSVYTLRFFNVDDNMYGFISNSSVTNDQVLYEPCCGGDSGDVDITAALVQGTNTLEVQDFNIQGGGYSYSWELKQDGNVIASDSCGTFISNPCNGGSTQSGLVYDTTFQFDVGAGVPEPGSVFLFLGGALVTLGGVRLRRRK